MLPMKAPSPTIVLAVLLAGACLGFGLPGVVALGLGAAVSILVGPWAQGQAAGSTLLKVGVVLLGAGTHFSEVLSVGSEGLLAASVTLTVAAVGSLILGKWLGLPRDLTLLIGTGTAICGGSAIAAAAPALGARGEDVGIAMAVVFVLNAAALVLFPMLGHAFQLDPAAYGRLCALAIHDTSSVVSAAAEWGEESLQIATVTKLARALWILPVAFLLSFVGSHGTSSHPSAPSTKGRKRLRVPGFLVAFLLASATVELFPVLRPLGGELAQGGSACLRLALLAMGLGLSKQAITGLGWRPLVHGSLLWILLSAVALVLCQ
jgi:uncharacterized integral membrane protein (TIGR00698 family)